MLTRLTGLALGLALMIAPAFADGNCNEQGQDGGQQCCRRDSSACEKACLEWNWAEESQVTKCGDRTCPNDLAMQEGKQPKRWAAGNPNYQLTIKNDCCWPDHVENDPNACRNNWGLGVPYHHQW